MPVGISNIPIKIPPIPIMAYTAIFLRLLVFYRLSFTSHKMRIDHHSQEYDTGNSIKTVYGQTDFH